MNKEMKSENGTALERATLLENGKKENNKLKVTLAIAVLVVVFAIVLVGFIFANNSLNLFKQNLGFGGENIDEKDIEVGNKGIISSATIIDTSTGTGPWDDNDEGPWDDNDEPGNDSSEDNDVVRSFDQVTWTVDLTMGLKDTSVAGSLTGGVIEVEASIPDTCANVMSWDTDSMLWMEDATLSEDGTTVTGKYSMSETETTIPGKQTLVFVLQVEGAGNGTEIVPTFEFKLTGNTENEKIKISDEKITVSAKGKYNIQLHNNSEYLSNKTTVNYGSGDVAGRMYGYSFVVQMYNENSSKGLKGIEYPKEEITFDIDLKLERSEFESTQLTDITDEATPILWNYRANNWEQTTSGNIPDREMYKGSALTVYDSYVPLGVFHKSEYSVYNSGNINITQNGRKLHVSINNYLFNGTFPHQACGQIQYLDRETIYTDNIGAFSVGYMQIFVPDTEASTIGDRNYYLTISNNNMKVTSITNKVETVQMNSSDDTIRTQHVLYKPGSYSQGIYVFNENRDYGSVESNVGVGDGRISLGSPMRISTKFLMDSTNEFDIYSSNRFIKFDGEAFEPTYLSNKNKFGTSGMNGNAKFNLWYVTKKDGSNWTSQTDMNNGNIEDMDIYENMEDIPEDKICIGIYVESISGYLARTSGHNNELYFMVKVKDTATIGKTYGITQRTWYWKEELDRSIYTITNPNVEWPETEWDSGNRQYIKTEYTEDGNVVSGTHSGGTQLGNTVLVVGSNLHGDIKAIKNEEEKVNYDIGKNENVVTYSVEPQLDANNNIAAQIENVTLKAEVTIPKGLEYIAGSANRGGSSYTEPEITENSDGSQTLVWYIYGVTTGDNIDPILFNAQIDNESTNGIQYTTTFIVSEVIGDDGISKIGNSKIDFRTSTEAINIINLASHRLYKEVETPIIEKNGDIVYSLIYENKTDDPVNDFQLLDILPYNGDTRGTSYNGTYTLENIEVVQTTSGEEQAVDNLSLYTTTSETVRTIDATDDGIGTDSIWKEKTIGNNINESATGFAITGEVAGRTRIELEVTLSTDNNQARDKYVNNAMAQVYADSEQMITGNVTTQVVYREINGRVWEDLNKNGTIDEDEPGMSGITVTLINTETQEEKTIQTELNGEYAFEDLAKGNYKVKVSGYGESLWLWRGIYINRKRSRNKPRDK